jgi:hypothetical protein
LNGDVQEQTAIEEFLNTEWDSNAIHNTIVGKVKLNGYVNDGVVVRMVVKSNCYDE